MKKQDIVNLIKYHINNNEDAFVSESADIARDFYNNGDEDIGQYIMDLISNNNVYKPQNKTYHFSFLKKIEYSNNMLFLPNAIEDDIIGITKSINNGYDVSKFLFYGAPGTGKTESALLIARLLNRDALSVNMEQLIDSKLGETSKNVVKLFEEIKHTLSEDVVIIFDELDSLVLNRIDNNDLREMGRVTSTFIKELDDLKDNFVVIATTNLIRNFDKALIRRFDSVISFDRYSKKDLIDISDELLKNYIKKALNAKQDIRLFNKILNNLDIVPYPGDMKQIIRTSIAFSDENNEYDYLRRVFLLLNNNDYSKLDIEKLSKEGYSTREIEIITNVPKSSVSRRLRGNTNE